MAKIFGCMDQAASNYNPQANVSDGSCRQPAYTLQLSSDSTTINPGDSATITGVVLKDGVIQPDIVVTFTARDKYIPFESAPPQGGGPGGPPPGGPVVTSTTTTVNQTPNMGGTPMGGTPMGGGGGGGTFMDNAQLSI